MLNDSSLPKYFWTNTVNTACYVMNIAFIKPLLKKTPYEIYKGRKFNISHFHVFGCKCYVLNNGKDTMLNQMKEYFLATHYIVKHLEFIIKEL